MNNKQLALSLAVQSLSPSVERNQGDWVIDLARRYEAFLDEEAHKDKFEVLMHSYGHSALTTISLIKDLNGKSFNEVNGVIESLPAVIKSDLSFEEAIAIRNQFFRLGSHITIEKCSIE